MSNLCFLEDLDPIINTTKYFMYFGEIDPIFMICKKFQIKLLEEMDPIFKTFEKLIFRFVGSLQFHLSKTRRAGFGPLFSKFLRNSIVTTTQILAQITWPRLTILTMVW